MPAEDSSMDIVTNCLMIHHLITAKKNVLTRKQALSVFENLKGIAYTTDKLKTKHLQSYRKPWRSCYLKN